MDVRNPDSISFMKPKPKAKKSTPAATPAKTVETGTPLACDCRDCDLSYCDCSDMEGATVLPVTEPPFTEPALRSPFTNPITNKALK
jgi:hypothetical protein